MRAMTDHEHCSACGAALRFRAAPYRWDGTCPSCLRYDVCVRDDGMDRELANSPQARAVMVKLLPPGVEGPREFVTPTRADPDADAGAGLRGSDERAPRRPHDQSRPNPTRGARGGHPRGAPAPPQEGLPWGP